MEHRPAQLQTLRRQYYSLYPLYQLRLPPADVLASNQDYLLSQILDDPSLSRSAPEAGYQKTFWRRVVSELEKGVAALVKEEPDAEHASPLLSSACKSLGLI
jgi:hypothetical protein